VALGLVKGSVYAVVYAAVFLIAARRRLPDLKTLFAHSDPEHPVEGESR
jgi:hypothetical protein